MQTGRICVIQRHNELGDLEAEVGFLWYESQSNADSRIETWIHTMQVFKQHKTEKKRQYASRQLNRV